MSVFRQCLNPALAGDWFRRSEFETELGRGASLNPALAGDWFRRKSVRLQHEAMQQSQSCLSRRLV